MGTLQSIDGRAFVGNTPVFTSKVGQTVQWDVMAMGSEHHTFHVHGHRWVTGDGTARHPERRARRVLPLPLEGADPGTWLYHCHVEDHMMAGMIGTYQVTRR